MKKSLSFYLSSQLNDSVSNTDLKEAQELSLYLDSLLEEYKPQYNMITEGLFDFLRRDESRKSFFGGLFASWGFGGKSKTQEAMEKMYEENAKRAKDRAEKLESALEDTRITKMQAKNAARQSMLDQTNNKKVQDLKNLKAKYDAEKKRWDDAAKNGVRTYTEAEIMAEDKRLEEMGTIIPPEEKGTIESLRMARINCFFDEDGNPRSADETKEMLKKMQNDSQFKDFIQDCINEANKQLSKADGTEADDSTWAKVYETLQNQAREDVGYSIDIENSEENLKTAEANLQAYNGNLTKEEASATDKYLKERKERAFAKLQTGEDLDDADKAALETLTKQDLADLGITDDDYSDLGIEETENGGIDCSQIKQDKLAGKVKAKKEETIKADIRTKINDAFPADDKGNGPELTYEEFKTKLKEAGIPTDKIPSEDTFKSLGTIDDSGKLIITSENLTKITGSGDGNILKDTISEAAQAKMTKDAQKITAKETPKAPEGVDATRITSYAERKMKGDDSEEKKSLTEAVEKQKTLVQQKKDFKTQIKSIQQHGASMKLNQELYDNVKIGDKTMREYLEDNQPLDPGESEKDGKRGIYVNGEFKERPSDSGKLADYDKERNKIVALAEEMPGDDGRHVRITTDDDGKAVAIITDKDGKETKVVVKDMPEDKAKEIASIMNTQKARESYKDKRKEIFSGIAASLKSGKELTDEQKDLLNSLPENFDMSSLEDLGLSKEDIKNIKDKVKPADSNDSSDDNSDDGSNDGSDDNSDDGSEDGGVDEDGRPKKPKSKITAHKNDNGTRGYTRQNLETGEKTHASKEEFQANKRAWKRYEKRVQQWNSEHQDDQIKDSLQSSLASYLKNAVLESKVSSNTKLRDFLLENLK